MNADETDQSKSNGMLSGFKLEVKPLLNSSNVMVPEPSLRTQNFSTRPTRLSSRS